jgi:uncharacterized protein YbjT (DUF2867 family)
MTKRNALLLGATGLVGSRCLEQLLESDLYSRVWVLSRRALEKKHEKLSVAVVDLENVSVDELPREFLEVDDVFCALGTTKKKAGSQERFARIDFGIPLEVARAARQAGARRFVVVSSVGADPESPVHYLRIKGDLERALGKIGFEALHILRPSMLEGPRDEKRTGEDIGRVLGRMVGPLMRGALRRYRPIQAETVAWAMLGAATRDQGGNVCVWESESLSNLARGI